MIKTFKSCSANKIWITSFYLADTKTIIQSLGLIIPKNSWTICIPSIFSGKLIFAVSVREQVFSQAIADRGSTVYGVESNTDMRRKAEKELCGFKKFFSIAASAENT